MLSGGALYATVYPYMKTHIISLGSYGKISLPLIFGLNHWIVILVFAAVSILLFRFFENKNI
jgi:hypothetical protein